MRILSTNNLLPSQMAVLPTKNTFKSKMSLDDLIAATKEELRRATNAVNGEREVIEELFARHTASQNPKEKDEIMHIINCYEDPVFSRSICRQKKLEEKLKSLLQQKEFLGQKHFPKI